MTYELMRKSLTDALTDLAILSGDQVGPSDSTWQDVTVTAVLNLRVLANCIEDSRNSSCPVFPSPAECAGKAWDEF